MANATCYNEPGNGAAGFSKTVYVPQGPRGIVPGVSFDSATTAHWWAALNTVVHSSRRLIYTFNQ